MIVNISIKLAIAVLYILDALAMALPIFSWLLIGVLANLSVSLFFWGWLMVMIFTATVWLKFIDRVKRRLWQALIERAPDDSDENPG